MKPASSLTVRVTDARRATTAATWGQVSVREWHGTASVIHGWAFPLPDGCVLDDVTRAIACILRRHDAMRTLFRDENGTLAQVVTGDGQLVIDIFQASEEEAREVADAISRRLSATPFDEATEWPVRMAIVSVGESPRYLALRCNRSVIDGRSLNLIAQELLQACEGQEAGALPVWQAVEEATYERSAAGKAVSDRAVGHWRAELAGAPPTMFDFPVFPPEQLRFTRLRMDSPAVERALQIIRSRSRFSSSALLLAAVNVVLSQYTGHPEVTMSMVVGNRMTSDRREMVGTLSSAGLFHLDLTGLTFSQVVRRTFGASGKGHQFGFCDPDAIAVLRDEMSLAHGGHVDLGFFVNDVQSDVQVTEDLPALTEDGLRELASKTEFIDEHGMSTKPVMVDMRVLFEAHNLSVPVKLKLTMFCDTAYVPLAAMREMLLGIERLLIAASARELAADELAAITGVTPVTRGVTWVRCGKGWVDVAAAREEWQRLTKETPAMIIAEDAPWDGDHRLVGYIAGPEVPDFANLHRRFVDSLVNRSDVRAPSLYRYVVAAPSEPADPAAWVSLPVLAEADGRRSPAWEEQAGDAVPHIEPRSGNLPDPNEFDIRRNPNLGLSRGISPG